MNPVNKSRRKPSREHRPSRKRCSLPEPVERRTRSTLPFPHEPGQAAGFVYFAESGVGRKPIINSQRLITRHPSPSRRLSSKTGGWGRLPEKPGDRDPGQGVRQSEKDV